MRVFALNRMEVEWQWDAMDNIPDNKVHAANMGPSWGWRDPGGPHVGLMKLAIWDITPHVDILSSPVKLRASPTGSDQERLHQLNYRHNRKPVWQPVLTHPHQQARNSQCRRLDMFNGNIIIDYMLSLRYNEIHDICSYAMKNMWSYCALFFSNTTSMSPK